MESNPLKVGILGRPSLKNETPLNSLRCFLNTEFNADHYFAIVFGLLSLMASPSYEGLKLRGQNGQNSSNCCLRSWRVNIGSTCNVLVILYLAGTSHYICNTMTMARSSRCCIVIAPTPVASVPSAAAEARAQRPSGTILFGSKSKPV